MEISWLQEKNSYNYLKVLSQYVQLKIHQTALRNWQHLSKSTFILRVILHIPVLDTKTFQQHNWIMASLKLPLLSPTQAEQALGEHLTGKKNEKTQRKYTKMKKGNKSNEISATCSCLYTLFFLAIKNPKDTHCRKEKKKKVTQGMLQFNAASKKCSESMSETPGFATSDTDTAKD